jgi:hypothetical protein
MSTNNGWARNGKGRKAATTTPARATAGRDCDHEAATTSALLAV